MLPFQREVLSVQILRGGLSIRCHNFSYWSTSVRTGRCQCGGVRYECAERSIETFVCHCEECRRQSASAFGISYFVARENFHLVSGAPQVWVRDADSGRKVECAFCSLCGSRLWHQSGPKSETISVKGGSLVDPVDISNAIHIWVSRKLPSVEIPDSARQHPKEPE